MFTSCTYVCVCVCVCVCCVWEIYEAYCTESRLAESLTNYRNKRETQTCQYWQAGKISFLFIFRYVAKLRKATISFVRYVRLSVQKEKLGSHWTDFHEIWYLSIFRKFVEKIQVSLKLGTNKGRYTWRPIHIFDHISFISS